jgi:hypothetical protein
VLNGVVAVVQVTASDEYLIAVGESSAKSPFPEVTEWAGIPLSRLVQDTPFVEALIKLPVLPGTVVVTTYLLDGEDSRYAKSYFLEVGVLVVCHVIPSVDLKYGEPFPPGKTCRIPAASSTSVGLVADPGKDRIVQLTPLVESAYSEVLAAKAINLLLKYMPLCQS